MRSAVAASFTLFIAAAVVPVNAASATPEQLVRQSVANYFHDYRVTATHYTYTQRDQEKNGSVTKVSVSQVLVVNGVPYERDISRNSEPLTPPQEAKEQEKLNKRRNESPAERAKDLKQYRDATVFLQEVPNAFTFTMLTEEVIDSRPNYVIECRPKATYRAHNSRAKMFSHIEAKLWIDKQDLQWTKADAQVLDTISIGWILARIGPGAKISIKLTRLTDEDWLPSAIDIDGDARVLLVKDHPIHERITSYDFKPVGVESPKVQAQR